MKYLKNNPILFVLIAIVIIAIASLFYNGVL